MRLILDRMGRLTRTPFWRDAVSSEDSAARPVLPLVLLFGLVATLTCLVERWTDPEFTLGIGVTPYEVGGACLSLLLVLRTNEGLGRWWEARKLWGGITNQCRSLAIAGLAYGPDDPAWRRSLVRWAAVFPHACRRSLRGERTVPEVAALVGEAEAAGVAEAQHMPTHVALVLARVLRTAVDRLGMDRFAFLQADKERAALIDHIGGCERILSTPIPRAYSIQIRRYLFFFLLILPFGLISKFTLYSPQVWWVPPIVMALAFPLLALDKIGADLQNPFSTENLGHLRLDTFTANLEANLLALLDGPAHPVEVPGLAADLDARASPA